MINAVKTNTLGAVINTITKGQGILDSGYHEPRLSREEEREREREIEDLGHSITGTENFHDLPSVR